MSWYTSISNGNHAITGRYESVSMGFIILSYLFNLYNSLPKVFWVKEAQIARFLMSDIDSKTCDKVDSVSRLK